MSRKSNENAMDLIIIYNIQYFYMQKNEDYFPKSKILFYSSIIKSIQTDHIMIDILTLSMNWRVF